MAPVVVDSRHRFPFVATTLRAVVNADAYTTHMDWCLASPCREVGLRVRGLLKVRRAAAGRPGVSIADTQGGGLAGGAEPTRVPPRELWNPIHLIHV